VHYRASAFHFTHKGCEYIFEALEANRKHVLKWFFWGAQREGDIGSSMFFISTGEVVVSTAISGNVCVLEAGSFFGEISLFHNIRRTATIQAQEVCEAMMVSQKDFNKLLVHYPRMHKIMNGIAERRFQELQETGDAMSEPEDTRVPVAAVPKSPIRVSLMSAVVSENDCVPVLYPGEALDFVLNPGTTPLNKDIGTMKNFTTIEDHKEQEKRAKDALGAFRMDELTACEGCSRTVSTETVEISPNMPSRGGALTCMRPSKHRSASENKIQVGIPSITRLTQSRLGGDKREHRDSVVSLTVSMHGEHGEEIIDYGRSSFGSEGVSRAFKNPPAATKSNMVYNRRSLDIRSEPDVGKEK